MIRALASRGLLLGGALVAGVLAAAAPLPARAAAPTTGPRVSLDLALCPAIAPADVRAIVTVELRTFLVDGVPPPFTTRVAARCDSARAEIRVDDPLTGKSVERVVNLGGTAPIARPHLLALAMVELVSASWVELASNPRPEAAAAPSVDRDAALAFVASRAPPAHPQRLSALAVVSMGTHLPACFGGGVLVSGDVRRRFGWAVDGTFVHGATTDPLGVVSLDAVSASAVVQVRGARGAITVRGGAGARVGEAWFTGNPGATAVGSSIRGYWWGPLATVGATVAAPRRLAFDLALEVGRAMRGPEARVDDAPSLAVSGAWARLALGVGFSL